MTDDYKSNKKAVDWILLLSFFGVWLASTYNENSIAVPIFMVTLWATAFACIRALPHVKGQPNKRNLFLGIIFCGIAGSIPPILADLIGWEEWAVIATLLVSLTHLFSINVNDMKSSEAHSIRLPNPKASRRKIGPRISILIEMGPQIGTYKGHEIPQFVRTLDGRILHFCSIASSHSSMEAEQVVLPPGIIYREDTEIEELLSRPD